MSIGHEFDESQPARPEGVFCASVSRCGWCYAIRYEAIPNTYWVTTDGVRHDSEPECIIGGHGEPVIGSKL